MRTVPIILGAVGLILGVGYLVTNEKNTPTSVTKKPQTADTLETDQSSNPEITPVDRASETTKQPTAVVAESDTPGTYALYDAQKIATSDADRIFLVFSATWCPSCRALKADTLANLATIPSGVEIYEVDYDTATDLKRQYGVVVQHSIIEISSDGTAVSPITHPPTLAALLAS